MNLDRLVEQLKEKIKGNIKITEPMKSHTSWKIGGPVDVMVFPQNQDDISITISLCRENQVPWMVLGNGSNLLVLDGGIRGVVLKTEGVLTRCTWSSSGVEAEAGVMLPYLAREAARRGLSGLEWCAGIPATIGGAVVMNAGVGNDSFGRYVQGVEVVDDSGKVFCLKAQDLQFGYRFSSLQGKSVVVTAVFLSLVPGDRERSENKIKEYIRKRRVTQPLEYPSAGSVFKNPAGDYAGRLIEAVGGKGLRQGGAEVSRKHANFIVNLGGASAADVIYLMNELKERVRKEFNTELQTEIRIVGEVR